MVKIRKRSTVLKYSLNLEHIAGDVVAYLLDIKNTRNSYSFGNKSTALSFNQKLNLLIDNNSITKEEKVKLEMFSGIRNQFMHNIYANSFTDASNAIDGFENKMRRFYPDNFKGDLEENLEKCVKSLYADGFKILTSFKGGVKDKMDITSDAKIYKEYFQKLDTSVKKNFKGLKNALNEFKGEVINKQNLLDVLRLMEIEVVSSPVIEFNLFDTK